MSVMESMERRVTALEAAAFRTGGDLADIRTELGHVHNETRGLAAWTERISTRVNAQHEETQTRLDALEAKLDRVIALLEGKGDA
jgi:hypothetical protein